MNKRRICACMAICTYFIGFIITNYGFSKVIVFQSDTLLEAFVFILSGLFLIILSSKLQSLMNRVSNFSKLAMQRGRWGIVASMVFLFLSTSAYAQESQTSLKLKSIELGSSQIIDSDGENFDNYFASFKIQVANIEDIKLQVHQYRKRDPFGRNSLQSFNLEATPLSWLSIQAGYSQTPVGSFKIGKSYGRLYLGFGGGRQAVISRSNAIGDRIVYKSGHVDFSLEVIENVSLGLTAERGRFGDDNNHRTLNPNLSLSKELGKFRIKNVVGYSERKLDHFSLYYWSPEIYREIFVNSDLGLEADAFWIYLNFSVDRILEERFADSVAGLRGWGVNGELSVGFGLGPGSIYLTGKFWNSGVQKFNSAYSGQVFQASYELDISE